MVVVSDKGTFIVYTAEEVGRMGIKVSEMKPFDLKRDAGIDPKEIVSASFFTTADS